MKRNNFLGRYAAFLFAAVLMSAALPWLMAWAADGVMYIDADGKSKSRDGVIEISSSKGDFTLGGRGRRDLVSTTWHICK